MILRSRRRVLVFGLVTLGFSLAGPARAATSVLVGWNDLGMHCMDGRDFSVYAILPPFNTIHAQLMIQGRLWTNPAGYTVTYQAVADPAGSINRTSQGKGNFWDHAGALFGTNLAPDMGLAGFAMPGPDNAARPMTFDRTNRWFTAEGIPVTPYDDSGRRNPYPMLRLTARNSANQIVASTDVVLPVSDEMDCEACHASGNHPAAEPAADWVWDCDRDQDTKYNVLRLHDGRRGGTAGYATLLQAAGYLADGLEATARSGRPILCARCHGSNAISGSGQAGVQPLTTVMHGRHATVFDPDFWELLEDAPGRAACYRCHPGDQTACLRGVMGGALDAAGRPAIECQSCHGKLSRLANPQRAGWWAEPNCQSCHTGTATRNSGAIRFTSVFDASGNVRTAATNLFATDPNVPVAGASLFRFSTGHGNLACSACHGSPHAEYPSGHTNDNVQVVRLQGHVGILGDCTACHTNSPSTRTGGPHGMHPVGSPWLSGHRSPGGTESNCAPCHGSNYRGTVLSRMLADRTFSSYGTKNWWRGFQVGCYNCHNGPNSEDGINNAPAAVQNATASVAAGRTVAIPLTATDANNNSLTLRVVSRPGHGGVAITNRTAYYTPDPNFAGSDSFTFAAWDGSTDSNLGRVTVAVSAAPVDLDVWVTAPLLVEQFHEAPFTATVTVRQGVATPTYEWSFGDGHRDTTGGAVCHPYVQSGDVPWTLTVRAGSVTQVFRGVITVWPAPVTPVSLTIHQAPDGTWITWPATGGRNQLEWTSRLLPPAPWQPETNAVWVGSNQLTAPIPSGDPQRFYRLRQD